MLFKFMEKKRVLIVDDEVAFTRNLRLSLEKTGLYEVREENKGRRVPAVLKEFKPDVILLDVLMPDADGGAVAARIQADPNFKEIPIIFLTATVTRREAGDKGINRGGLYFLAKPATIEQIVECIESHFKPKEDSKNVPHKKSAVNHEKPSDSAQIPPTA